MASISRSHRIGIDYCIDKHRLIWIYQGQRINIYSTQAVLTIKAVCQIASDGKRMFDQKKELKEKTNAYQAINVKKSLELKPISSRDF